MSTLQRRHFQVIARIISEHNAPGLAESFADYLAQINPLFDRRRFLEACGKPAFTEEQRRENQRKLGLD